MRKKLKEQLPIIEIREAIANYMKSEGCSCCRDYEAHNKNRQRLEKLFGLSEGQFLSLANPETYGI